MWTGARQPHPEGFARGGGRGVGCRTGKPGSGLGLVLVWTDMGIRATQSNGLCLTRHKNVPGPQAVT